jgi:squalene-hopene/tetraprenyl-beta-curcumene cyclase
VLISDVRVSPGPVRPLPPHLREVAGEARRWLTAHVIGSVSDDGAVRDRCRSRVLESALAVHLLRVERSAPRAAESARGYLRECRRRLADDDSPVARFEKALVHGALGEPAGSAGAMGFLDDFEHFTSPRKRFMFRVLLTELGVLSAAPEPDPDIAEFGYDEYATWVNLEMCAFRVLSAFQRGRPSDVTDDDRRFLHETMASGSDRAIFEADVFAHLIGLLALRRTHPDSPLLSAGVDAVLRAQNPDGGFPFIVGWEPFLTAVAGLGLHGVGAPAEVCNAMAGYLTRHQGPDGGWPFAPRVRQSDADCTPFCLEFVRAVDPRRFAGAVTRAEAYLARLVNGDGGFATYFHGDTAEVGVTGSAVAALAGNPEFAAVRTAAIRHLVHRQRADGTFERGWSLSEANAMMRAFLAFGRHDPVSDRGLAGEIAVAVKIGTNRLVATQATDGGWGQHPGLPSDELSTCFSLICLASSSEDDAVRAGVEYLLARQGADGGFSSLPDSAGPRPLPHDAPSLADGYALIALNHVLAER